MNEIEIVDLMLKFDYEYNPNGNGFQQPRIIFDAINAPEDARHYVLASVIEMELFEYNNPKHGIRATNKGRKIYKDGGYKKFKTIGDLKTGLSVLWKALDIFT